MFIYLSTCLDLDNLIHDVLPQAAKTYKNSLNAADISTRVKPEHCNNNFKSYYIAISADGFLNIFKEISQNFLACP